MPAGKAAARKTAFPPVVDANTRLLILGSLPGEASLKAAQYYGHPRNAFWRLLGEVTGRDLVPMPYPNRLEVLTTAGIGLWDVIAHAARHGSLDSAIREAARADLNQLVLALPELRAVAFNGATAARIGRRNLTVRTDIRRIDLPSSSPALTRSFASKAEAWMALRPFVITP